jgi:tryptophan halogenase
MLPRKILIVGSGAEAWMTAAHLDGVLNRDGRRFADIAVLDLPGAPQTGVGESTLASFNHALAVMGIDQFEFMRRADGTFKQSTKFVNWLHAGGHAFHHPFGLERTDPVDRVGRRWLRSNRSMPFAETISVQPGLCEMNLAPQMPGPWDFGQPLPFAYHLDEAKFADYLREVSTARGVTRYVDALAGVDIVENGDIAAVNTASGSRLQADLFVDCTGPAALLSGKELGAEWDDCSQWLPCDQVVTMQVPYEHFYPGYVRPFTTATALSAGWVLEIPLRDRRSLCYVHCGDFLEQGDAEAELRAFEGKHADSLSVNTSSFQTGRRMNAWVGNCIAVGNSAGMTDPLVSTHLYMCSLAAAMLADHFPFGDELPPLAFRFNRIMANRFYEVLDFVNLHYCLTQRSDTDFWIEAQKRDRVNDRLQAKLDYWRHKPPSRSDFEDQFFPGQAERPLHSSGLPGDYRSPVDTAGLWGYEDYEVVLYGMDFLREECDDWFGEDRPDPRVLASVVARLNIARKKLPSHDLWLKNVFGMPDYPAWKQVIN